MGERRAFQVLAYALQEYTGASSARLSNVLQASASPIGGAYDRVASKILSAELEPDSAACLVELRKVAEGRE